MIATMTDYQKLQDWCQKTSILVFPVVGIVAIALGVVENPRFAVGIVILSVTVPVI